MENTRMTDYEKICEFETLYQAHRKARRHKRHKTDVILFEMDLARNLCVLKERLEHRTYKVGGYNRFMIHDPKDREIQALSYTDRVVLHDLCDNVLTPFFENRLIYDNCACRRGKGTHFGMDRLAGFMREYYKKHGRNGWVLKADVRKYFPSVDHDVLITRLRKIITDPEIMTLLESTIRSWNTEEGRGLAMGNQTSQLFALYYLDPADRLIKEKLRIKYYTRYMDDMVLVHEDKDYLRECLRQLRALCKDELKLELNEKTQIFPLSHGVDYLGWHFNLTNTGKVIKRLRTQSKRRMKRCIKGLQKGYAEGRLSLEDIKRSFAAARGHLLHGHTYYLRGKVYKHTVFIRDTEQLLEKALEKDRYQQEMHKPRAPSPPPNPRESERKPDS
jgi:retron-type reverse transcriptase